MLAAFLVSGNTPTSEDGDAEIVDYLASESHQRANWIALLLFMVGTLFLVVFFAALRGRLRAAEGREGRLTALAWGGGLITAALWMGSVSLFAAPFISANHADSLDTESVAWIYRFSSDAGYGMWVAATICGTLVAFATAALALRTGVLPRWFAWTTIVVGVICLAAVFFIPGFVYWLWILIASVVLAVRAPVAAPAPAATPLPAAG
jgi:hypothetical protein